MLLLCLTALTVVLLVRVVGIVLVIALLTLPAAVAGHFARQLWQMMAVAVLCCMVFVTAGIAVSYPLEPAQRPGDYSHRRGGVLAGNVRRCPAATVTSAYSVEERIGTRP